MKLTLDVMLDIEMLMKFAPASVATAFASMVFPVPGGPNRSMPLQGWIQKELKWGMILVYNQIKIIIQLHSKDSGKLYDINRLKNHILRRKRPCEVKCYLDLLKTFEDGHILSTNYRSYKKKYIDMKIWNWYGDS